MSEIEHRLCRILDFALTALRVLVPVLSEQDPSAASDTPVEKVIAETGLLLLVAGRSVPTCPGLQGRVDALAASLQAHARSDRILASVLLRPATAYEFSAAHICLSRLGYPCQEFDDALAASLRASVARSRERLPYQELELSWLAGIWGQDQFRSNPRPRLGTTGLRTDIDALLGGRLQLYHFTHTLLYWTDFGATARRFPRAKGAVTADAEVALARCLDDDDFDLSAELLLTWPMIRTRASFAASFALDVLLRTEDELGFLPSLGADRSQYDSLEGDARLACVAKQNYHTIYVMGMLCAVILRFGWAPLAGSPVAGFTRALSPLVGCSQSRRKWELAFETLNDAQRDSLAHFQVAIALRRAYVDSDFRRVRDILALIVEHRLAPSPAIVQAAQFLQRCAGSPRLRVNAGPARDGQSWSAITA
jgi:hypothetical protein